MLKKFILVFFALSTTLVFSEDSYYCIPIKDLNVEEGKFIHNYYDSQSSYSETFFRYPYVAINDGGEAYIALGGQYYSSMGDKVKKGFLVVRTSQYGQLKGSLYAVQSYENKMREYKFTIPVTAKTKDAQEKYYATKIRYYTMMQNNNLPGAAWFRSQRRIAEQAYKKFFNKEVETDFWGQSYYSRRYGLQDTFDFFTGNRALSENLQVDVALQGNGSGDRNIAINSIKGITVEEMDWKELIKDIKIEKDPLVKQIPADQHVLLFSTFSSMINMFDEVDKNGTPILQLLETKSQDAKTGVRYKKQLCLETSGMSRYLGPQIINSVAITGSDMFMRMGTDVAILFEAKLPALIIQNLKGKYAAAKKAVTTAKDVQGEILGVQYHGLVSANREICSYYVTLGSTVVVTNSKWQLQRIIETSQGKTKSIGSLDEYTFFRNRYPRTEGTTALLFISDATIRRWCGPKWRIADSRRIRAAAVMSDAQMRHLDQLVSFKITEESKLAEGISITTQGVHSSQYNTIEFMTPIAEMNVDKVTQEEANAYNQFRDSYERQWRWVFDPIGIQLEVQDGKLSADVSIIPLIGSSDYRELIDITAGSQLDANSGDFHDETVFQVAMSINPKSQIIAWLDSYNHNQIGHSVYSWLGNSVTVYGDQDMFWKVFQWLEFEDDRHLGDFMEKYWYRSPVAFYLDSKNQDKLKQFIEAWKAKHGSYVNWEKVQENGFEYYKITPRTEDMARHPSLRKSVVYLATAPSALVITFTKPMLDRILNRELARRKGTYQYKQEIPGKNFVVDVKSTLLETAATALENEYYKQVQKNSWKNIPILTELKRRYPQQNPVDLYEKWWGIRLLCPAGGEYVWHQELKYIESSAVGHPHNAKWPKNFVTPWDFIQEMKMGLTFEHDGLRARVQVKRK